MQNLCKRRSHDGENDQTTKHDLFSCTSLSLHPKGLQSVFLWCFVLHLPCRSKIWNQQLTATHLLSLEHYNIHHYANVCSPIPPAEDAHSSAPFTGVINEAGIHMSVLKALALVFSRVTRYQLHSYIKN